MECNRDEANRAKEIAESKFIRKDIIGAKKFALKAQNLYPDLDGISQFVATLEIYLAAENKINNESDFYGILGVNPSADDDTVRKHYRKLALFLHPDKNKSVGADGAFKYISEAWSMLSDKAKRLSYDQKRNTKVFTQNGGAPPPGQNGFYNFTRNTTTSRAKGTTPKDRGTTSTGDKQTKQKTFWTVCHGCKMQYEYLRMYLHQNLLCPNCHEPFLAMETAAPNTKVSTKGFKSQKGRPKSTSQKGESTHMGFQWGPFSKTSVSGSSAQAVTMVQQTYEKVKREREEAQAAVKREEALKRKKNLKRSGNIPSSGQVNSVKRKQEEVDVVRGETSIGVFDIRTQLVKKARHEIRKKLKELSSKPMVRHKEENEKEIADDLENGDSTKIIIEPLLIEVVDPDFHSFDSKRCEMCFKEGDLWAVYDDDDGMPRHHALIREVSSLDPFKLKVCWLNSGTDNTFGELKIGKNKTLSNTNYFSHKVNYTKLDNGNFQVYPRKGDVWALYRNWSPEWNDDAPNDVKHKYEIVELDEFDEEAGFTVTQLLKVAGFKTVFHRHLNRKEARVIPESEIFRFSHQIPSYVLTGKEADNAPKGCYELDPAATPDEFLQVIADLQEEPENVYGDQNHDHIDESTDLAEVKEVATTNDDQNHDHNDESTDLAEVKEVATTNDDESTVLAEVKKAVTINDDESTVLAEVKEVVIVDDEQ